MSDARTAVGLLGTTTRFTVFLAVADALAWGLAAEFAARGDRFAAVFLAWSAASLLLVTVLYARAATGANPGAIMKGHRHAWAQPVLWPYRFVAWCITSSVRVVRPALWDISAVAPGVYVGVRLPPSAVPRLAREGIECILDLAAELPDNRALASPPFERMVVPVLDRCAPTLDELDRATEWVHARVRDGKKVYLHCAFGRGRSATVAAAVLVRMGVARTADEAVAIVARARPLIGVKGVQYERLVAFAAVHAPSSAR